MLNEKQKKMALTQINATSNAQHYFVVHENEAQHENSVLLRYKGQVNRMIEIGNLIPFVPCFDLL